MLNNLYIKSYLIYCDLFESLSPSVFIFKYPGDALRPTEPAHHRKHSLRSPRPIAHRRHGRCMDGQEKIHQIEKQHPSLPQTRWWQAYEMPATIGYFLIYPSSKAAYFFRLTTAIIISSLKRAYLFTLVNKSNHLS